MALLDFRSYCDLLDKASREHYALPAINALDLATANAAVEGFAEAKSDGIVQLTATAGVHASGVAKNAVLGAITLAEHVHRLAAEYNVNIALHTDHCPTERVDSFLKPLIAETAKRRAAGLPNLFQSHMYDGSGLPMKENLAHAVELMKMCRDNEIVLEIEVGVVGGDEDGANTTGARRQKLYTTTEDMLLAYEKLSEAGGRFMVAATFGNVHGVYKPGAVVLKPSILREGQDAIVRKHGPRARMWLVFHGGSGTSIGEIHETIDYGIVKMNIHTDTQYAFTRAVADHIFRNYDGVLKVDGEVGVKSAYLASTLLDRGREAMARRVVQACNELKSAGKTTGGN